MFKVPADFKSRSGLGFIHMNVRSLLPKLDLVRILAENTSADVIVISETWLKKTVSDNAIDIDGYTVYRTDRPNRGGGVAIYVKDSLEVTVLLSESVVKKYELLALNLIVSKTLHLTVVATDPHQLVLMPFPP